MSKMFTQHRLLSKKHKNSYCDLWLHEQTGASLPALYFFDGALSASDVQARLHEQIHIPFFNRLIQDIYRYSAAPFNFVCIPCPEKELDEIDYLYSLLDEISERMDERSHTRGQLHLLSYSKGAQISFRYLIDGGFDSCDIGSFSSFSGAHMFNPQKLKLPEVLNRIKNLPMTIGTGRQCPFFLANHIFHSTLCDLKIPHDYVVYKDHYIRSFYSRMISAIAWYLLEDKPLYPKNLGYTESCDMEGV